MSLHDGKIGCETVREAEEKKKKHRGMGYEKKHKGSPEPHFYP